MQIKNILIITDALTRPLYNPRVRNLYKYLIQHNIEADWFTEHYEDIPTDLQISPLQISFYKHKGLLGRIEWFFKNILTLLVDYKNIYFSQQCLKAAQHKKYDLVFCSTFHTFGLKAAHTIAKSQNIPLHIDLRDIAEQCNNNEYNKSAIARTFIGKIYRRINISRRNQILKQANCITTVSPWHVDFIKQFNPNTHLIYNGYDTSLFQPQTIKSDFFDIIYTGKWYGKSMQDPSLLFEALAQINNPQIRLVWYTNDNMHALIHQLTKHHNITTPVIVNGYVPNHHIPQLLNQSSIILVLTNRHNQGIMTTKFFEALGVEKPILCVRSDEGCLAQVINETQSGLAATNVNEVKHFILHHFAQWQQNGYTHLNINNKEQFTRQNQARQFVDLFNQTIK